MKLTKIFSYLIAVFLISLCCLILVVHAFDVAQEAGDSQPQKLTNALIKAYDSVGSDDTVVVFTWMKDVDFTEQSKEAALEAIGMS